MDLAPRVIAGDRVSPPLHPSVTPGSKSHLSLGPLSHPSPELLTVWSLLVTHHMARYKPPSSE